MLLLALLFHALVVVCLIQCPCSLLPAHHIVAIVVLIIVVGQLLWPLQFCSASCPATGRSPSSGPEFESDLGSELGVRGYGSEAPAAESANAICGLKFIMKARTTTSE